MGLYTNGLYKIYGWMGKEYLWGIVTYSPTSVFKKWAFVKTRKYHLDGDAKPQWYKIKYGKNK